MAEVREQMEAMGTVRLCMWALRVELKERLVGGVILKMKHITAVTMRMLLHYEEEKHKYTKFSEELLLM